MLGTGVDSGPFFCLDCFVGAPPRLAPIAASIGWESRTSRLLGEPETPGYAEGVDAECRAQKEISHG
jgi:hypothetical protein